MEEIKQFLKDHQILPRISFKDRQEHTVQVVKAKPESFNNDKDEMVEGIKFLVMENGEPKTFFTASQDLLMKLADSVSGETYKIKMSAKNVGGEVRTYYEVEKVGTEEIPVTEEDSAEFKEREGL